MNKEKDFTEKQMEPEKKGNKSKKFFHSARFKHGGMATAFTAGFIVVVILINVIVSQLGTRFPSINIDLTANSLNTLSEDAIEVVDSVELPTTITIFASEQDVLSNNLSMNGFNYSQVGILAAKMAERNSNITVQYVDLDMNPSYSTGYSDVTPTTGCVLVETEKRHRLLQLSDLFPTEMDYSTFTSNSYSQVDGALASAVNQANSDALPVVAFATGHNEMIDTTTLKQILNTNSFDVVEFNIMTEEIPENTQLIVLATPSTDYTQEELSKLDAYLNDNQRPATRSVLITFYPSQKEMPNLATFMAEWGMEVTPNQMLYETNTQNVVGDLSSILVNAESDENLDAEFSYTKPLLAPYISPINILFESQASVSTYPLLTTQDTTFLADGSITEMPSDPETQSYVVAAVGQKYYNLDNELYTANVITLGSSLFIGSGLVDASAYANGDYILDLVKYATGTTDSDLGVVMHRVQNTTNDISMDQNLVGILGLGVFTLLPLIGLLIVGIVVYLKRRHL